MINGKSGLTDVHVEPHELGSEKVVHRVVGPNQEDASENGRDEVVSSPPTLNPRAVHFQNTFPNGKCAIVPD